MNEPEPEPESMSDVWAVKPYRKADAPTSGQANPDPARASALREERQRMLDALAEAKEALEDGQDELRWWRAQLAPHAPERGPARPVSQRRPARPPQPIGEPKWTVSRK